MGSMSRNDARGLSLAKLLEQREPASDRPIKRRHMDREQEIAEEQRISRRVGDGEIVVGMGGRLRLEQERAPAKIEVEAILDSKRRHDDFDPLERLLAQH